MNIFNTGVWGRGGLPELNVAATCGNTQALGPGRRAAVWVQGCPLNCTGCIAPDWIPLQEARFVEPEKLADELLQHPEVTGLTFSGGEPMLQAAGLARLARAARIRRDLTVICFTGMTLEHLRSRPSVSGVAELLAEIDLLIDGPYVAALNDGAGLRGSQNQRFHYLTDRLRGNAVELEGEARRAEVHVRDGDVLLVGVPPPGVLDNFRTAVAQVSGGITETRKGDKEERK